MKRSAHSFRVRVSVAQTLDDACVDGTFFARRAETPDAWRRFNEKKQVCPEGTAKKSQRSHRT